MKSIVAAAMLLSVSFASFSQSLSIFGFELGKALTLAECPYKAIGTTKLYDRTKERLTQDEVERIRL